MQATKGCSQRTRYRRFKRLGAATVMFSALMASQTYAQSDRDTFTQDELRALPRVCHAQRYVNRELAAEIVPAGERELWLAKLGTDYVTFHHFCWGLIRMRRGAADPSESDYYYQTAVREFNFVIKNSHAGFTLIPEVYLRKGQALRFLGRNAEAASTFLDAVKAKKDYSPAYAALIQLHLDLGDRDTAQSVLETGLQHAPGSKILAEQKERLASLPR